MAMNGELLIKDVLEVYSRLFDHHPALQGHIGYFMKEFEEKRGTSELTKLTASNQHLSDLNGMLLPEKRGTSELTKLTASNQHLSDLNGMLLPVCADYAQIHFSKVIEKVNEAKAVCETILGKEGTIENEFLLNEREKRSKAWIEFMKSQCEKSAEVDQEIDTKTQEITAYYSELEEKLRLSAIV